MKKLLVLFLLLSAALGNAENLLMNGAMDSEQSDFPPFWYTETSKTTRYERNGGPGGKGAVVLSGEHANLRQQGMVLVSGEKYKLSGRFMTKNFKAGSFMFVVHSFAWQKDCGLRSLPENTDGWVMFETEVTMVPSNSIYGVAVHMAKASGEVRVTDIMLEPISEKAITDSKNPMAIPTRQIIPISPLLNKIPVENSKLTLSIGKLPKPNTAYIARYAGKTVPVDEKGYFIIVLEGLAKGDHSLQVELLERDSSNVVASETFAVTIVETPKIDAGNHRVLNNLVTELHRGKIESGGKITFDNPRDGWVFFRAAAGTELTLNGQTVLNTPEMFQLLPMGRHTVSAKNGGEVIIRAVPEILSYPSLAGNGWDLARKYVLGNANILNRGGEKVTPEQLKTAKATGAVFVPNSNPFHGDKSVESIRKTIENNFGMTDPEMAGVAVDETFFTSPLDLANYVKALGELNNPDNKPVYTWIVGKPSTILHTDFMSMALNAAKGRGRLLYEAYCLVYPTAAAERDYLEDMLVGSMRQFKRFYAESTGRTDVVLGIFSRPAYITLNSRPNVDFKAALDIQFHTLTNHPELKGLGGVGYWGFNYADEEITRWAFTLIRHYAIEGNKELLAPKYGFKYNPGFLQDGDFTEQLKHWETKGAVSAGKYSGLNGKIQKRWGGEGDNFCVLKKEAGQTAEVSQTVRGLTPGQVYSLTYLTADLNEVRKNLITSRKYGIGVTLDGAEIIPGAKVLIEGGKAPRINVGKLRFKATAPEARLTFNNAAAADGEELIVNFVQLTPYFSE